ncbi:hypothetical protein [Dactylosporangium salmoneum]|uniref:Uncharacterized protein n=1 Tax=Dactylosporangium salmoneum TaxID=53361 RepID=A0ABN3FLV2_9ACTN
MNAPDGQLEVAPAHKGVTRPDVEAAFRTAWWAAATKGEHADFGMALQDGIDETGGMFRRTLLLALATYGAGFRAAPTEVTQADEGRASVDGLIDEWRQACDEYGFEYHTQPRRELARDLVGDLLDVRQLLMSASGDSQVRSLAAVVARLAALTALACTDLGYRREVKHLWRLGRRMAHLAKDPAVLQWVYGHETTSGIYFGRPLDVVMTIADQGLAVSAAPTAGRAELLGGKAQALAIVGEHQAAARVLRTLEETFDQLPDRVTNRSKSIMGWPERRLRHAESFVHSTAGALTLATRAQDRALHLYAPSRVISRTQIELHRAECLIRAGYISDGARHARETLAHTTEQWRNRYILATAAKVADAVPDDQRTVPAVAGLCNDLAAAFQPTASN